MLLNGQTIPFADSKELYMLPQLFSEPVLPSGRPMTLSEIKELEQIWLEPISPDSDLRNELRGWYQVKDLFVQNEYGNRFYLDTYWNQMAGVSPKTINLYPRRVRMQHECKITVLETIVFPDYQKKYLANPQSGPCPCFKAGDTFLLKRTSEQDDFYHLMNGKFCGEAWDAISRYVYTALQGGSIMHKWTNDERMMIACCNDGTRPVIFKIERIDIPETPEEEKWLKQQDFTNHADDAYTG